jgi:hypothetical protein
VALREEDEMTRQMRGREFDRARHEAAEWAKSVAVLASAVVAMALLMRCAGLDDYGDRVRDLSGGAATVEVAR